MLESRGKWGEGFKSTCGDHKVLYCISLYCCLQSTVNNMINMSCYERCFNGYWTINKDGNECLNWVITLDLLACQLSKMMALLTGLRLSPSLFKAWTTRQFNSMGQKGKSSRIWKINSIHLVFDHLKPSEWCERWWLSNLKKQFRGVFSPMSSETRALFRAYLIFRW